MTIAEKAIYQQVHPFKLWTDLLSGMIGLYLFWQHNFLLGLFISFFPTIIVSWIILTYINIDRLKYAYWGKYVHKYMTREYQVLKLFGFVFMSFSAWFHSLFLILVGLLIILYAWLHGKLFP